MTVENNGQIKCGYTPDGRSAIASPFGDRHTTSWTQARAMTDALDRLKQNETLTGSRQENPPKPPSTT
jgi:hypothetical protein